MVYCEHCGHHISEKASYCRTCGAQKSQKSKKFQKTHKTHKTQKTHTSNRSQQSPPTYPTQYPMPYPQHPQYQQYPQYLQYPPPGYPYYPIPPKKDNNVIIAIIIILIVVFVIMPIIFAGVLYVWVSGFSEGGSVSIFVSARVTDKTEYFQVEILKVSAGSLHLEDVKFSVSTDTSIQIYSRTINDANPSKLVSGNTEAYPIPSGSGSSPVIESSIVGDGATVDSNSISKPQVWENCYLCFVDATGDSKVNADDTILVYKDYNNDGVIDIRSDYMLKLFDGNDDEVLRKIF